VAGTPWVIKVKRYNIGTVNGMTNPKKIKSFYQSLG
jgi:hypothetical protein